VPVDAKVLIHLLDDWAEAGRHVESPLRLLAYRDTRNTNAIACLAEVGSLRDRTVEVLLELHHGLIADERGRGNGTGDDLRNPVGPARQSPSV